MLPILFQAICADSIAVTHMKKITGILFFAFVYFLAFGIALSVGVILYQNGMHVLLNLLIMDVIATVIVYVFGLINKSPSIYDPYWSVQTLIFYVFLLILYNNWNLGTILVLIAVSYYTIRLTANFFIGFDDIHYIDWRYKMLREKSGKFFQFVNFFGINMMPTLLVYLASVPFFVYAVDQSFLFTDFIGLIVIVLAVTLEMIADIQMKQFAKTRTSRAEVLDKGLWRLSRHPNYLGEISVWAGGAMLLIGHTDQWWWIAGAIGMVLLFLFISIPMIEKNYLTYKPTYQEYRERTSVLLLLPPKKK